MADFSPTQRQCSRCEVLPEKLVGPGRLHLWPPLGHTLGKAYKHLRAQGWFCETPEDRSIVVRLDEDRLSDLFAVLSEALTNREVEDTRALFKPGVEGLTVSDIPRARSLRHLATLGGSGWLIDMLSEGRLTRHFQPIVYVDAPEEVYAQECLPRGIGTDGRVVSPAPIFEAARENDMLFQLDLAARLSAVREAVRHGTENNLFINFTPTSVYDPSFVCVRPSEAWTRRPWITDAWCSRLPRPSRPGTWST